MPDAPFSIDWFPVENAKAAVAVLPGGAYHVLAPHEGEPVAQWLNTLGVAAAVVKYRRGGEWRHPIPLQDAMAGIRFCRDHAQTVGVLGFSAGGHLAASVSNATDQERTDAGYDASARPDFAVLCYPVIHMTAPYHHGGSRKNLLGDVDDATASNFDMSRRVTAETPPTFVFHTAGDPGVPVENALNYVMALRQAKVPFSLHITDDSANPGHGCGLAAPESLNHTWTHHVAAWLRDRGWAAR